MASIARLLILSLSMLPGGCDRQEDLAVLEGRVAELEGRAGAALQPLPAYIGHQPFAYSAAGLPSPFAPTLAVPGGLEEVRGPVAPDPHRHRETLEAHALGGLRMVGSVARAQRLWALVQDEGGGIHRVTVGNYLGRNHGRIIEVSSQHLRLVEIVTDGSSGWVERPQTLSLGE